VIQESGILGLPAVMQVPIVRTKCISRSQVWPELKTEPASSDTVNNKPYLYQQYP
jgi:hypothetical protein